jgi:hypothetical protein
MNSPYLGPVRSAFSAAFAAVLLAACGGGGGGGGGPPPADVTISGRITFDRIPFDTTFGNGLNPAAPVQSPAREVTVQAIEASSSNVLATATTDANGNYSVVVPANRNLFIRARAEMVKTGAAPTWNFSVRNNTTAGTNDALYALDGDPASSGTANSTRDLNAPSGFGTTSYTDERAAAPFAILDTVFKAKQLVLSATPNAAFPALSLFWSEDNRPTAGRFCPDDGDIGTSSYIVFTANEMDQCTPPRTNSDGIYILGDFSGGVGDTDEFDESVIAHEFGHYIEDRFGRSDSIGGEHSGSDSLLDLRVAFGEGWGNAFSSMVRNDPIYRDSFDGVQGDFHLDMEADDQNNEGWFSEASVEEILWDLFDSANEPGDTLAMGFPPLFAVMTGAQVTTDALTSIFTFATGLRAANPGDQAAIDVLLHAENINGVGDFGVGESNDGDPNADTRVLPLYDTIGLGSNKSVCSRSPFGNTSSNKLGNRVFVEFVNDVQRLVTITATGAVMPTDPTSVAATDPDIFVLRRGVLAAFAVDTGSSDSTGQVSLVAGSYIIEVYDFDVDGAAPAPRCMTVSITGT